MKWLLGSVLALGLYALLAAQACAEKQAGAARTADGNTDWGPWVGPWNRYEKNPIITLEGKETYSIQNGPQSLIRWKGQWRLYYNGWTLNPKAKNRIGAEYAIGLALVK